MLTNGCGFVQQLPQPWHAGARMQLRVQPVLHVLVATLELMVHNLLAPLCRWGGWVSILRRSTNQEAGRKKRCFELFVFVKTDEERIQLSLACFFL